MRTLFYLGLSLATQTVGLACQAVCGSKPAVSFLGFTNENARVSIDDLRQFDATALISFLFVGVTHPED